MMNGSNLVLIFIAVLSLHGQTLIGQKNRAQSEVFKLSEPRIEVDSLLFFESATIISKRGEQGAKLYFRKNGERFAYTKPIELTETSSLKFWAEHTDFASSDVQQIAVRKISTSLENSSIGSIPKPHESYQGNGYRTLVDLEKGSTNFRNAKKWLGFQNKTVEINIERPGPIKISAISIGLLRDHGSWIFLPKSIEIKAGSETIGQKEINDPINGEKSVSTFETVKISPGEYHSLTFVIHSLEKIPNWHQGKGTIPWLFIDEILIEP